MVEHSSLSDSTFHDYERIMWNPDYTTLSDKERWFLQGIATPCLLQQQEVQSVTSSSTNVTQDTITSCPGNTKNVGDNRRSYIEDYSSWGLTQTHGGPCGVLATIQAHMIQYLFYQSDTMNNDTSTTATPTTMSTETITDIHNSTYSLIPRFHQEQIQKALAWSIGIILARASIQPNLRDNNNLNSVDNDFNHQYNETEENCIVTVILPKRSKGWNNIRQLSHFNAMSSLDCHTIRSPKSSTSSTTMTDTIPKSNLSRTRDDQILHMAELVSDFLLSPHYHDDHTNENNDSFLYLNWFFRQGGVLLLTMSLVASRGIYKLQNDMDDPYSSHLTGQFGHCSQELINLLLTGQAVSNVFDNTLTISGSLQIYGIQHQPSIGYLSLLESLRYCQVGSYYKSPKFPIWVIGSMSHFSIMFGDYKSLEESKSDLLLMKCQRAFKSMEGGEENGFIDVASLEGVLMALGLVNTEEDDDYKMSSTNSDMNTKNSNVDGKNVKLDKHAIEALSASLEISGAGIILWDDFWKASSRLLTGASLESVLQALGNDDVNQNMNLDTASTDVQILGIEGSEGNSIFSDVDDKDVKFDSSDHLFNDNHHGADIAMGAPQSVMESDEEMARRLAAEWGAQDQDWNPHSHDTNNNYAASASTPYATIGSALNERSDEELARELQAEEDRLYGNFSTLNNNNLGNTNRNLEKDFIGKTVSFPDSTHTEEEGKEDQDDDHSSSKIPEDTSVHDNTTSNESSSSIAASQQTNTTTTARSQTTATTTTTSTRENSTFSANHNPTSLDNNNNTQQQNNQVDTSIIPFNNSSTNNLNFEKFGHSFQLNYFNGLRGGQFTSFRVTRLSPEEAVGCSVALSTTGGGGSSSHYGIVDSGVGGSILGSNVGNSSSNTDGIIRLGSGGSGDDLEAVVRTKYPSCLFDWCGKNPPEID